MQNCHVVGYVQRFHVEYQKDEFKPGTIVTLVGKPINVFLCLDSIRNPSKLNLDVRIKSIRCLEEVTLKHASIKKAGYPIVDDESGEGNPEINVDIDFDFPGKEPMLSQSFLRFLKLKIEPCILAQEQKIYNFLNHMSERVNQYNFFFFTYLLIYYLSFHRKPWSEVTGNYSSISGMKELKKSMSVWYQGGSMIMLLRTDCNGNSFLSQILKAFDSEKIEHKFTNESQVYWLQDGRWEVIKDPQSLKEGTHILVFDRRLMEKKLWDALTTLDLTASAPFLFHANLRELALVKSTFQDQQSEFVSVVKKQTGFWEKSIITKMKELMNFN